MVNIIKNQNQEMYQCEECGLKYEIKENAERCQAWCKEHKNCNLDLIQYAAKDSMDNVEN